MWKLGTIYLLHSVQISTSGKSLLSKVIHSNCWQLRKYQTCCERVAWIATETSHGPHGILICILKEKPAKQKFKYLSLSSYLIWILLMDNLMFPITVLMKDPSHDEFFKDKKFPVRNKWSVLRWSVLNHTTAGKKCSLDWLSKPLGGPLSQFTNTHTVLKMLSVNTYQFRF